MAVDLTPEQVNEAFAQLANTEPVRCQCILGCPDHRRGGCKTQAAWTFEVHLLGSCRSDEANPAGNRVEILCEVCAGRLVAFVAEMVARLRRVAQLRSADVQCGSCGATIAGTQDVLRSSKRWPGGLR